MLEIRRDPYATRRGKHPARRSGFDDEQSRRESQELPARVAMRGVPILGATSLERKDQQGGIAVIETAQPLYSPESPD